MFLTRCLPRCQLMSFRENGLRKALFSSLLTCQKCSVLQVPGGGLERPGGICHSEHLRSGLLRAKSQAWQFCCRVLFSLAVMSACPGLKPHLPSHSVFIQMQVILEPKPCLGFMDLLTKSHERHCALDSHRKSKAN